MKYISASEYLMSRIKLEDLPSDYVANMNTLIPRVNELLEHFSQYRQVNSGYRSQADQDRINPGAPHSKHLICAAVDLEDKDRALSKFCLNNLDLLKKIGLWMEDPGHTATWTHLQCIAPASGKIVFIP